MDYLEYITSNHSLYDRYYDDWKLCLNSWYGGTEYKNARLLRAYQVDFNTPSEAISTYVTNEDGSVVSKIRAQVTQGSTPESTKRGQEVIEGSFYGEKLDNTPLYNYVKLIVAEYNSILFRNPPQRVLPDTPEVKEFLKNVSGDNNESINEFMSLVDMYTTIFGVCHVGCYKPIGSDIPKWRIHTPLDVTNWSYRYDIDGNLKLDSIVIKIEDSDYHTIYRHMTPTKMETLFIGKDDNSDYVPPISDPALEQIGDNSYRIVQENELGYIPVKTCYMSTKVYNNVGTTIIQDVAQIQRSIYGDMAEIYQSITYSSHPTLIIDTETDQLNDGQIAAEPGGIVRVNGSLTGAADNYVYEYVAPPMDSITEIRELVDNKIQKLSQIAMIRSEDIIKSSRSGEQIEVYDDKLASLIRRKATNLENLESKLWEVWADWMNMQLPEDFAISYSRQYNKRAVEQEVAELSHIMNAYEKFAQVFEHHSVTEEDTQEEYATAAQAEARAKELGGSGYHEHQEEDGTIVYMPFPTHDQMEMALKTNYSDEYASELKEDLRDKIRQRLLELVNSTSTNNSL